MPDIKLRHSRLSLFIQVEIHLFFDSGANIGGIANSTYRDEAEIVL